MIENKLFGKYRGFVTRNDDPLKKGRIKAIIPDLFGDIESNWCLSANNFIQGCVFIPNIDDKIWIEFENGNQNLPIYTSTWDISLPTEIKNNYPDTNIIKSESGIKIILDDKDKEFKIIHPSGYEIKVTSFEIKIIFDTDKIEINSSGINIKSDGIINIDGKSMTNINSIGPVNIIGSTVNLG